MRVDRSLAVGVSCLGLLVGAQPANAGARCAPPAGVQSSDVRTAERPDGGSEITEYHPDGSYRVSRCASDGRVEVAQVVAPVASRQGMRMVPVSTFISDRSRYGGQSLAVTYLADAEGYAITDAPTQPASAAAKRGRAYSTAKAIPPTERRRTSLDGGPNPSRAGTDSLGPIARVALTDPGCSQDGYTFIGLQISTGYYPYHARVTSMPNGDSDRAAITRGHHTWNHTVSACGFPDVTNIAADYIGMTTATVHTYADGVNVVDFGNPAVLGCFAQPGFVLIACTSGLTNDGVFFSDIDQRYSNSISFYNGTGSVPSGRVDLWSLASHESGHAVGLSHNAGGTFLTMFPTLGEGQLRARDLGLGDARGLRCRYGITVGGC